MLLHTGLNHKPEEAAQVALRSEFRQKARKKFADLQAVPPLQLDDDSLFAGDVLVERSDVDARACVRARSFLETTSICRPRAVTPSTYATSTGDLCPPHYLAGGWRFRTTRVSQTALQLNSRVSTPAGALHYPPILRRGSTRHGSVGEVEQ